MLMRDEWLAALQTHFDDASHVLTIRHNGAVAAQGDLETAEGRAAIEQFFATRYAGQIKGPPKVLTSPGHSFSDVARKVVSIINLASVRAIENMVGHPVHPLRFRANLYVEGWPAWHEFDLLDRTLAIGDARLKVVKRIVRCAAVNVDPDTAERDLAIPQALQRRLGHGDCGIYAEVTTGGSIAVGDAIMAEAAGAVVRLAVVPAVRNCDDAGTHNTSGNCFYALVVFFLFQQHRPRRMGPGASPGRWIDMRLHSRDALRPRFASNFPPSKSRGRREYRMRAAPEVSCAMGRKNAHMSIQGSGEHPTFPAQGRVRASKA